MEISKQLEKIKESGLYRRTCMVEGMQSTSVTINGQKKLLLCSNNYLGLAEHPSLIEASASASQLYGASSGASRLVSGTMELHENLEIALAQFKETESALVFNSGHGANTGIIPALVGRGDVIFSDRLNHASIVDGAILSGAKFIRYNHNDIMHLEQLLEKHRGNGRCVIVTDGVFSMDGDYARLPDLVDLKKRYNALFMVDDAHGCGVLGVNGRGLSQMFAVEGYVDIQMGTLGKAFGSFGAYAAVSKEIRELLINRARSFIFSTSLPPAVLAASLAAVTIITSEEGKSLRESLLKNAAYFRKQLIDSGFDLPPGESQIVPIITVNPDTTMEFSQKLMECGVFVQGIRPPTVPVGSCRLRCTLMATHTKEQLDEAVQKIGYVGKKLGVI